MIAQHNNCSRHSPDIKESLENRPGGNGNDQKFNYLSSNLKNLDYFVLLFELAFDFPPSPIVVAESGH